MWIIRVTCSKDGGEPFIIEEAEFESQFEMDQYYELIQKILQFATTKGSNKPIMQCPGCEQIISNPDSNYCPSCGLCLRSYINNLRGG